VSGPELVEALGLDPARRVAILHADDVGMCHGANTAFIELFRTGRLDCGSTMVPCPWFPEIGRLAAEDPSLDLGVHLTLTSEWAGYRWGPLTRQPKSSGLVDDEGYFHRQVAPLAAVVGAEAAEEEMRAQVDRALAFGMKPTHIDTHMGGALCPPLVEAYCRVGRDYRLPVLLPRRGDYYGRVLKADPAAAEKWADAFAQLEEEGMPLVDDFRMTPGVPTEESEVAYRNLVGTLPQGITFVALHPNSPGDIESIVPPRAHYRTDETRLLGSGAVAEWLDDAGVQTVGMRALHKLYQRNLKHSVPA
jgi:chitin disaccharide deacetylase